MTACINVCWDVLLVLLEYLIWSTVIVEVYPEIHPYHHVQLKLCCCLAADKLPELSHDFMGAFRNEAGCGMGIID